MQKQGKLTSIEMDGGKKATKRKSKRCQRLFDKDDKKN